MCKTKSVSRNKHWGGDKFGDLIYGSSLTDHELVCKKDWLDKDFLSSFVALKVARAVFAVEESIFVLV